MMVLDVQKNTADQGKNEAPLSGLNLDFDKLQILGPFNSGTTLMFNYKHHLFQIKSAYNLVFWKHSIPPTYEWERGCLWQKGDKSRIGQLMEETLFVCMVRGPYFWAHSTCKNNYNIEFEKGCEKFSDCIRSKVNMKGLYFSNIIDIWNEYYRRYLKYLPNQKTLFVRLEDLAGNPETIVPALARYLAVKPEIDTEEKIEEIRSKPSKNHFGAPCNYGEKAVNDYRIDNIKSVISVADLRFINENLDTDLMEKFDYTFVS